MNCAENLARGMVGQELFKMLLTRDAQCIYNKISTKNYKDSARHELHHCGTAEFLTEMFRISL